jgi:hypothetical protein
MLKSSQLLFSSALNLPKEEFQSSLRLIVNLSHLRAHAMLPSAHGASLLQLRLLAEIQLWLLSSHLLYSNAQTFHLKKKKKNSSSWPNQASEDSSPVCLEELSLKIEDIEAMGSTKEAQAITVDQDLRTMREKEDTMEDIRVIDTIEVAKIDLKDVMEDMVADIIDKVMKMNNKIQDSIIDHRLKLQEQTWMMETWSSLPEFHSEEALRRN